MDAQTIFVLAYLAVCYVVVPVVLIGGLIWAIVEIYIPILRSMRDNPSTSHHFSLRAAVDYAVGGSFIALWLWAPWYAWRRISVEP